MKHLFRLNQFKSWFSKKENCFNSRGELLAIISAISFTFSCFGQQQYTKEYSLDFFNYGYSTSEAEHVQNFAQRPGGYCIGGSVDGGSSNDAVLVTLEENGNLAGINNRYVIDGYHDRNIHVNHITSKVVGLDGYLLCGLAYKPEDRRNIFIKTNMAGDVQWAKQLRVQDYFGDYEEFEIREVKQMQNGRVMVVALLHNNVENQEILVFRLSPSNGIIDWSRRYNSDVTDNKLIPNGIVEGEAGEYYIFGNAYYERRAPILHITDGSSGPVFEEFRTLTFPGGSTLPIPDITAMTYEPESNSFILGGILNGTGSGAEAYDYIFAGRINDDLTNLRALDQTPNQVSIYSVWDEIAERMLTHILTDETRIILNGYVFDSYNPGMEYSEFSIVCSMSGAIWNRKTSGFETYMTYSTNSYIGDNHYVWGQNIKPNKYRVQAYSMMGNNCSVEDESVVIGTYPAANSISELTIYEGEFLENSVEVTVEDYPVEVTEICSTCMEPIVDIDPITTESGEYFICSGGSQTLVAPVGYSGYTWIHSGEIVGYGSTLSITEAGNYTLVVYNEEGCEAEISIEITDYTACSIDLPFREVSYCSITPATAPDYVGWPTNPLQGCTGKYSFKWYFNGSLVGGNPPYGNNTPFVGPGYYEVFITTPCGTFAFSQLVEDELVASTGCLEAMPNFDVYNTVGGVTYATFNAPGFVGTDLQEWTITDGSSTVVSYGGGYFPYTPYSGIPLTVTCKLYDYDDCTTCTGSITWSHVSKKSAVINNGGQGVINSGASSNLSIEAYPNPAQDNFTVLLESYNSELTYILSIYNLQGQLIFSQNMNSNRLELETEQLENGTYILKVQSSEGQGTTKVTVLK